mgnify:CR=1 FL=1
MNVVTNKITEKVIEKPQLALEETEDFVKIIAQMLKNRK